MYQWSSLSPLGHGRWALCSKHFPYLSIRILFWFVFSTLALVNVRKKFFFSNDFSSPRYFFFSKNSNKTKHTKIKQTSTILHLIFHLQMIDTECFDSGKEKKNKIIDENSVLHVFSLRLLTLFFILKHYVESSVLNFKQIKFRYSAHVSPIQFHSNRN